MMKDAIDFSKVLIHNAPQEVKNWPITVHLDQIHMKQLPDFYVKSHGIKPVFDRLTWPPEKYGIAYNPKRKFHFTLWFFLKDEYGLWHGTAGKEFEEGQEWSGRPLLTSFRDWCWEGDRSPWGAMSKLKPVSGTEIGFMVAAGNQWNNQNIQTVRERSQIVTCFLRENSFWTFDREHPSASQFGNSGLVAKFTSRADLEAEKENEAPMTNNNDESSVQTAILRQILQTLQGFDTRITSLESVAVTQSHQISGILEMVKKPVDLNDLYLEGDVEGVFGPRFLKLKMVKYKSKGVNKLI